MNERKSCRIAFNSHSWYNNNNKQVKKITTMYVHFTTIIVSSYCWWDLLWWQVIPSVTPNTTKLTLNPNHAHWPKEHNSPNVDKSLWNDSLRLRPKDISESLFLIEWLCFKLEEVSSGLLVSEVLWFVKDAGSCPHKITVETNKPIHFASNADILELDCRIQDYLQ